MLFRSSEEKHEPVSDIDTAMVVDSLKALDPRRPIREADIKRQAGPAGSVENDPRRTLCTTVRPLHEHKYGCREKVLDFLLD